MCQLESFTIFDSHVVAVFEILKVNHQVLHFIVILIVVEADYGNAVVELEGKGVDTVVHKYDVAGIALVENAHILHVEVGVMRADTALSVESRLDQGAVRV